MHIILLMSYRHIHNYEYICRYYSLEIYGPLIWIFRVLPSRKTQKTYTSLHLPYWYITFLNFYIFSSFPINEKTEKELHANLIYTKISWNVNRVSNVFTDPGCWIKELESRLPSLAQSRVTPPRNLITLLHKYKP